MVVILLLQKVDDYLMKKSPDLVAEVRELLRRSSKVVSDLAESDEREDSAVEAAYQLLKVYITGHEVASRRAHYKAWIVSTRGSGFFSGCLNRVFNQAIKYRDRIEEGSNTLELYAVALSIIRDYETYCLERAAEKAVLAKHIKEQRKIIEARREEFLMALAKRDGLFCQCCGAVEGLVIDHIEPLSDWGLSVLENLQLLCRFCNGSKGIRDMDYLERMNKKRKRAIK